MTVNHGRHPMEGLIYTSEPSATDIRSALPRSLMASAAGTLRNGLGEDKVDSG